MCACVLHIYCTLNHNFYAIKTSLMLVRNKYQFSSKMSISCFVFPCNCNSNFLQDLWRTISTSTWITCPPKCLRRDFLVSLKQLQYLLVSTLQRSPYLFYLLCIITWEEFLLITMVRYHLDQVTSSKPSKIYLNVLYIDSSTLYILFWSDLRALT